MGDAFLTVDGLTVEYLTDIGPLTAVDDVCITVKRGETVGLVGETGCGKSTLARAIPRLLPPRCKITSGRVLFDGKDLLRFEEEDIRRLRGGDISMIFQDPTTFLNPVMKTGDQIMEVILYHDGVREKEARARMLEVLNKLQFSSPEMVAESYPHELSGGMKQRAIIAMAIACNPSLIIADEPTTSLDVTIQAEVLDLLKVLKDQLEASLLLITHDLGIVADICDRVYVMYAGKIDEYGEVRSIYRSPKHPYTEGLIKSVSAMEEPGNFYHIEGNIVDMLSPPTGCRFHPRCDKVMEICKTVEPPLIRIGSDQSVYCHLHGS